LLIVCKIKYLNYQIKKFKTYIKVLGKLIQQENSLKGKTHQKEIKKIKSIKNFNKKKVIF